ncbi:MAG: transposase [Kangiellaceae bacterium]|nr:transposase [Kangiellaceae bacterium]
MPYHELKKGRFSEAGRIYFVTANTSDRVPHFLDFLTSRLLVEVMRDMERRQMVDFLAWVIMPDHAHWLIQLNEHYSLSKVMSHLKGNSARMINSKLENKGKLWQSNFHDHGLRKEADIKQIARYIVANPLRANLVEDIGDYPHWDAKWL